ncbi:hypothetical protein ANN_03598 [Periplaneta americana]|uniref:RNase H type-1 domain-containing protein n=1 Tax=Periplaneta americana TaxID=6978 RepID=A0ABQ8TZF0_PERAM|nr:hypothetical protein ANN_03598 [Periplaneta americana]
MAGLCEGGNEPPGSLKACKSFPFPNIVLSNSKAAISAIGNYLLQPANNDIQQCREDIKKLNKIVHLQWIPYHCGIAGIEAADFLAKKGTTIPLSFSNMLPFHRASTNISSRVRQCFHKSLEDQIKDKHWKDALNSTLPEWPRREAVATFMTVWLITSTAWLYYPAPTACSVDVPTPWTQTTLRLVQHFHLSALWIGRFRQYDYGNVENKRRYGSASPPEYKLNNVKVPVSLHYSDHDALSPRTVRINYKNIVVLDVHFKVCHDVTVVSQRFEASFSFYVSVFRISPDRWTTTTSRCRGIGTKLLEGLMAVMASVFMMAADGDCRHLCKLMAPVRHRWSINDVIGGIRNTDVMLLKEQLPNLIGAYRVPLAQFNHLDFIWGKDAKTLLYDSVKRAKTIQLLQRGEQKQVGEIGMRRSKRTVRKYDSILKVLSSLENANIFLERVILTNSVLLIICGLGSVWRTVGTSLVERVGVKYIKKLRCPYAEACYTYRIQAAIGLHTTVMHITDPPVLLQSPFHKAHDVTYTPCTLNLILVTLCPSAEACHGELQGSSGRKKTETEGDHKDFYTTARLDKCRLRHKMAEDRATGARISTQSVCNQEIPFPK